MNALRPSTGGTGKHLRPSAPRETGHAQTDVQAHAPGLSPSHSRFSTEMAEAEGPHPVLRPLRPAEDGTERLPNTAMGEARLSV